MEINGYGFKCLTDDGNLTLIANNKFVTKTWGFELLTLTPEDIIKHVYKKGNFLINDRIILTYFEDGVSKKVFLPFIPLRKSRYQLSLLKDFLDRVKPNG